MEREQQLNRNMYTVKMHLDLRSVWKAQSVCRESWALCGEKGQVLPATAEFEVNPDQVNEKEQGGKLAST